MQKYSNALYAVVVLSAILALLASASTHVIGEDYYFYIYGSGSCPHCQALKQFLTETYGSSRVYFCDLDVNATCRALFVDFVKIGLPGAVPTTFIVYKGTVSAVVIGEYKDREFFDKLLVVNKGSEVPVYVPGVSGPILLGYLTIEGRHEDFIAKYLSPSGPCTSVAVNISFHPPIEQGGSNPSTLLASSLVEVLPALLILGLLDSVNPCTMMLYFTFTVSCLSSRRSAGAPLLFLILIYIGYFALGYGLVLTTAVIPSRVFTVLALIMGIYTMVRAGRSRSSSLKCEVCEKLSGVSRLLSNPYFMAAVLAAFSLFVLLPCTAGPLVAFVSILAGRPPIVRIPALLLYNVVFIAPLAAIFVAVALLGREKSIASWLKKNSDVLEFLAGLALVIVALILLFT